MTLVDSRIRTKSHRGEFTKIKITSLPLFWAKFKSKAARRFTSRLCNFSVLSAQVIMVPWSRHMVYFNPAVVFIQTEEHGSFVARC